MQDFMAASLLLIIDTADWQALQYSPYSPA